MHRKHPSFWPWPTHVYDHITLSLFDRLWIMQAVLLGRKEENEMGGGGVPAFSFFAFRRESCMGFLFFISDKCPFSPPLSILLSWQVVRPSVLLLLVFPPFLTHLDANASFAAGEGKPKPPSPPLLVLPSGHYALTTRFTHEHT